jgi:hypothetical protein
VTCGVPWPASDGGATGCAPLPAFEAVLASVCPAEVRLEQAPLATNAATATNSQA